MFREGGLLFPWSEQFSTIILSDIHLTEAQEHVEEKPLWKLYKRREHFVDGSFHRLLEKCYRDIHGKIELILNGDIFDFDSVLSVPKDGISVNWVEKLRGLEPEESKSRFKMQIIIQNHPVFFDAIREFILKGHRLVFVIGNHDIELFWNSVQDDILAALALPKDKQKNILFCDWFYISNKDTFIEHGHQYDSYSMCHDPIHPFVMQNGKVFVRQPFGNLANRYMMNGMGLFNPHVDGSYIKSSLFEYLVFFYRYIIGTQPLLVLTWLWGAVVTLIQSFNYGLLPKLKDPFTLEKHIEDIAKRSQSTSAVVRTLKAIHAHPAIFSPLRLMRELWLDRAILVGLIFFGAFQIYSLVNLIYQVNFWLFWVMVFILFPFLVFYSRSIQSEMYQVDRVIRRFLPMTAKITGVNRIVQGHTHCEQHLWVGQIEYLNSGSWSPAFRDIACKKPYGRKCFVWIKPVDRSKNRQALLMEWRDPEMVEVPIGTKKVRI